MQSDGFAVKQASSRSPNISTKKCLVQAQTHAKGGMELPGAGGGAGLGGAAGRSCVCTQHRWDMHRPCEPRPHVTQGAYGLSHNAYTCVPAGGGLCHVMSAYGLSHNAYTCVPALHARVCPHRVYSCPHGFITPPLLTPCLYVLLFHARFPCGLPDRHLSWRLLACHLSTVSSPSL